MAKFDAIIYAENDGLIIPEVGPWAMRKYNLVGHYCNIFTSAMKNKFDKLVYIDLFAGAGYANVREIGRTVHTSALIAMSIPNPFDYYILSEFSMEKCKALHTRITKNFPDIPYNIYQGDSNKNVDAICQELQYISDRNNTLCFCFVDPFSLNLHFETIRKLAAFRTDFLILLAIQMDFVRNLELYMDERNKSIEQFLANKDWRLDLQKSPDRPEIMKFLASQYDTNMVNLGYQKPVAKEQIKTNLRNVPMYYLAFYSRHPLGNDFFEKISYHGQNLQLKLF